MASGRLVLPLAEPCLSSVGLPQSGSSLTVYETGTTTLATLYADEGLTTPIANPQISDSAGRFYAQTTVIWADDTDAYDCVLSFPDGETFSYTAVWLIGAPNLITGYAPINSPTFTGDPQAPTPAVNDSSANIATTAFVAAAIAAVEFIPSGMVAPFAMVTPPAGWLICDGTAISRTTYAALYAAIGVVFGAGDGATTFNLPDLRGEFVRGLDSGREVDPARSFGSTQTDAVQGHAHDWAANTTNNSGVAAGWASGGDNQVYQNRTSSGGSNTGISGPPVTDTTSGSTYGTARVANETRPTNVALIFAIKT